MPRHCSRGHVGHSRSGPLSTAKHLPPSSYFTTDTMGTIAAGSTLDPDPLTFEPEVNSGGEWPAVSAATEVEGGRGIPPYLRGTLLVIMLESQYLAYLVPCSLDTLGSFCDWQYFGTPIRRCKVVPCSVLVPCLIPCSQHHLTPQPIIKDT